VLRSPLSNILGLAQMLKNEGGTFKEKKREEFLGHLLLSANTLDEAISEIVVDS
jgi:K+-sensing histidine kinase KdpD